MKIENSGPLRSRNLSLVKNNGTAQKSNFTQVLTQHDTAVATLEPNSAVLGSENLWVLQEISDQETKKRELYKRGQSILEYLESLRLDLLSGTITLNKIEKLQKILATERQVIEDPKLIEILNEIELRAWVELAKLEK